MKGGHSMELKRLSRILMRTAAVLLVLVMMSTALVTGRFARYTSSASGSDSARVAKFEVTENTDSLTIETAADVIPGGTIKKDIIVTNNSEVAIEYRIAVRSIYENLPLTFSVQVGESVQSAPFTANMAPGETKDYTLIAEWTGSNDISYAGKVDMLEITLSATQID
jgi:hypothetical protein